MWRHLWGCDHKDEVTKGQALSLEAKARGSRLWSDPFHLSLPPSLSPSPKCDLFTEGARGGCRRWWLVTRSTLSLRPRLEVTRHWNDHLWIWASLPPFPPPNMTFFFCAWRMIGNDDVINEGSIWVWDTSRGSQHWVSPVIVWLTFLPGLEMWPQGSKGKQRTHKLGFGSRNL